MTSSLRIVVAQGHRNTSGGNPVERAKTPALANAIVDALTAAGHRPVSLQNDDGSTDDWFDGSLDAVARRVMHLHQVSPVDLMLDIHIESDPASTPGIFAIVPDGDGLRTLTPYPSTDRATPGSRDRRFGKAIASEIARATGLHLRTRTVVEPGVMSERQTHVGSDLGWRLAMFGYTAPARKRMVRLVIECGNLTADAKIINQADFPRRVARGVAAGVARALRDGVAVPPGPSAPEPLFPGFGTSHELLQPQRVRVAVPRLRVRKYAETTQPIMTEWTEGTRFHACGWIIGETVEGNPVWWITGEGKASDRRWRVWSGGTDCAGHRVLALPHHPIIPAAHP